MTGEGEFKGGRGRPVKREVAVKAARLVCEGIYKSATEAALALVADHYGQANFSPYVPDSKDRKTVYWQFRAKIIEELRKVPREGRLKNFNIWVELSENTKYKLRKEKGKLLERARLRREILDALHTIERRRRLERLHRFKAKPVRQGNRLLRLGLRKRG
jgi:hypothetical protein